MTTQTAGRKDRFVYLPKSKAAYAAQLALHKYLLNLEKDLINELDAINLFLSRFDRDCRHAEHCYASTGIAELIHPEIQKNRSELYAWQNDDYEHSTNRTEDLTVPTIGGFNVRSKSEALIANILIERGIPFRYEWVQVIDNRSYAPDFTIMHPITRKIIIWEHFGLMSSANYQSDYWHKMNRYISSGLIPYYNLITTYETNTRPFSVEIANRIVRMMFDC